MKGKNILIASGLFLAAISAFGYKKVKAGQEVLKNLEFTVKSISGIYFSFPDIAFNVELNVKNKTNIDFGATLGSSIVIKRIDLFDEQGTYLGNAITNIYSINLPAYETITLPKFTVYMNSMLALQEFGQNIDLYLQSNFSKLKFNIVLEVFGSEITLNA